MTPRGRAACGRAQERLALKAGTVSALFPGGFGLAARAEAFDLLREDSSRDAAFGTGGALQDIAGRLAQPLAVFQAMPHALARRDSMLEAVNAQRGLTTRQTYAARLFPRHVNLLTAHWGAVRFCNPVN